MASVSLDIKQKHNKLLVDLSDLIDPRGQSWTNFIGFMYNAALPAGRLQQAKDKPFDVFHLMEEKGILKEGDYSALEQTLKASGNMQALEMVKKVGSEITMQMKGQGSTTIATQGTSAASDASDSHKKRNIETQLTTTAGDDSPSNKKRKTVTQGTGAAGDEQGELSEVVYDREGMTGFLLILNFITNRDGTKYDASELKTFFGKTLRFDVLDPREEKKHDLTLSELDHELEQTKRRLNDSSKRYYCFFCAILSHGDKEGILCHDKKFKPIDEIWKTFTNDKMENFAGKPKVFLIQACRGKDVQRGHLVKDDESEGSDDTKYVAEETSVPTDADVLLAYATTPGYVAWRNVSSGTWFIQTTLKVFKEHHKQEHVEEMFIRVRNIIALDRDFRAQGDGRMMPCTWTTLTKMLRI